MNILIKYFEYRTLRKRTFAVYLKIDVAKMGLCLHLLAMRRITQIQ